MKRRHFYFFTILGSSLITPPIIYLSLQAQNDYQIAKIPTELDVKITMLFLGVGTILLFIFTLLPLAFTFLGIPSIIRFHKRRGTYYKDMRTQLNQVYLTIEEWAGHG